MLLNIFLDRIEKYLPAQSGMEGDRIGLQVQSDNKEVNKILVALDITQEIISEAVYSNCDCIISFHPLIYNPLTSIAFNNRVGRLTAKLISKNITLIVIHTNFDVFYKGTSQILAKKLDFNVIDFLKPNLNFPNSGMGVIAKPFTAIKPSELLSRVHNVCHSPLRFSKLNLDVDIEKIAIVGGSGMSFLDEVLKSDVQAFITADITYHRFHEVEGEIMLIDPGHYEMEQFVPLALVELFGDIIDKNELHFIKTSKTLTNPVCYYPDTEMYINLQNKYLLKNNIAVEFL